MFANELKYIKTKVSKKTIENKEDCDNLSDNVEQKPKKFKKTKTT